ncbi:unnamed protein product [Brachionus calyciflorus]|uniref:Ubiquitin-like domain-containing protein n=1 Tax=Brachionus calyciflorus TaxID=104777 RepID=A0A813NTU6_9BILA|nr:unnamed protein product [Brachionus calyciflorus]
MGCISSSTYCHPRRRFNRNQCDTQSQTSDPQELSRRSHADNHRSSSFSNITSNSFHSNLSNSHTQFSIYVPPTGKNKRLKKPNVKYFKSDKKISESQLAAKREEFWDTAPAFEGKPEIWSALKAAVEALENKNIQLAQAIIDSANIIVPNGLLSDCYDELGNRYQIPIYVLAKPSNLIKTDKTELSSDYSSPNLKKSKKKKKKLDSSEDDLSGVDMNKIENGPSTSKTEINSELLQIKLRVSSLVQDTNSDLKIMVNLNETILNLKQKLCDMKSIDVKNQRFFFGGRLMRDKDKLKNFNLRKNVVIQVIVRDNLELKEF